MAPRHKKSFLLRTNKAAPLTEEGRKNFDKIFSKEKKEKKHIDMRAVCGSETVCGTFIFADSEKKTLMFDGIVHTVSPDTLFVDDIPFAVGAIIEIELFTVNGERVEGNVNVHIKYNFK